MAQVIRMPLPRPTLKEIEALCADAIQAYKRYERKRLLLLGLWVAALLLAACAITQYFLKHPW